MPAGVGRRTARRALAVGLLATLSLTCGGRPAPTAFETIGKDLFQEDCVLFGYARTDVIKEYSSACSTMPDLGGPTVNATVWFNCRREDQGVVGRGYRWTQCLNGRVHESGGKAYQVSTGGCVLTDGICQIHSDALPDLPLGVDGESPEGLLLRSVYQRITKVRAQVMAEGGSDLADRLALVDASELFADLADVAFNETSASHAVTAVEVAKRLLDLASDFTPGVSLAKDAAIILTGVNPVTGEMVSDLERGLLAGGLLVPAFLSGGAKGLVKSAEHLANLAGSTRASANRAADLVSSLRRADEEAELLYLAPCASAAAPPGLRRASPATAPPGQDTGGGALPIPLAEAAVTPLAAPCSRNLGAATAEIAERAQDTLASLRRGEVGFGQSSRQDYRKTFRQHYPEVVDEVGQVHHAVEQDVLQRYPGLVSETEIHSLQNLRGIPKGPEGMDLHQSKLRNEWTKFYKAMEDMGVVPTREDLLRYARLLDDKFGSQFIPRVR